MKIKKIIIISLAIVCLIGTQIQNAFIINAEELIPFLFTLLGFCFAAYTLLYSPISEMLTNATDETKVSLNNLLSEFEDNMVCIFICTIIILVFDSIKYYDVPLVKNITNINLVIIQIESLKDFGINFIISGCTGISFYALYDFMQATFNIIRASLNRLLKRK